MASLSENKPLKICMVNISYGKGGAERTMGLLSDMLTNKGFEVTNVILTDRIDYKFSGKLYNLGKDKKDPDWPWARFLRFRKLRKFLKAEKFDLIIDHRSRAFWKKELFYLYYIYAQQNLLYVVHNYMTWNYLTHKRWVGQKMIDKTLGMIGVSEAISLKLKKEYPGIDIETIYNPTEEIQIQKPENWSLGEDYILFLGRLDEEVKNIPLLIEAYHFSELYKKEIPLVIMGAGENTQVKSEIKKYELEKHIQVLPYNAQVGYYLKKAKFLALSSKFEGFPMVIIEALSVGIPVVSVDCQSGPKEVIKNEENGLLVENYNPKALGNAMRKMYENKNLYDFCVQNAKTSIAHLKQEEIAKKWENYITAVLNRE